LRVAGYELRVAGYGLRVMGCGLWVMVMQGYTRQLVRSQKKPPHYYREGIYITVDKFHTNSFSPPNMRRGGYSSNMTTWYVFVK
jgi:hypothetical protein